jgi:uncharacterized membrane protein
MPGQRAGVPLQKMRVPWIPLPAVWGYLTGAIEIATGALMLADRQTRAAASWMGLVVTVLVLAIYTPFLGVAVEGKDQLEALNYIWDTLLFAGAVLLVARPSARYPSRSPLLGPLAVLHPGGAVTLLLVAHRRVRLAVTHRHDDLGLERQPRRFRDPDA